MFKRIFTVFAAVVIVALSLSAVRSDYASDAITEEVYSAPFFAPENYGVEVKPPVDIENNLSELEGAATVTFGEEYVIIHGTSGGDAKTLSDALWKKYKLFVDFVKDTKKESANEILAGNTNRPLSAKLKALVDSASSGGENYAWGYMVENGKLAFYASGTYGYNRIFEEFEELFFAETSFFAKEGTLVIRVKSIEEHKAEQEAIAEAEKEYARLHRLEVALEKLEALKGSDAFGEAELMPSDRYEDPLYYPATGEHPRVMINSETLEKVKALVEKIDSGDKQYAAYKDIIKTIREYADSDFDGVFPEIEGKDYTYNAKLMATIEAKAFMYLLTDDPIYGYEAILCLKNAYLTMTYTKQVEKDTYRGYYWLLWIASEVYDWCYDLMTEEDKAQFIGGARTIIFPQLEFTYPPSNMSGVTGHGVGAQFLQAIFSFSVAIFDERPDWWDFVGGRFYEEYVEPIDYLVQGGYYSQGNSLYIHGKLYNIYMTSWQHLMLFGNIPFDDAIEDLAASFMLSQIMPNDKYFDTGDGVATGEGTTVRGVYSVWMLPAAAVFQNESIMANAKYYGAETNVINGVVSTMTQVYKLIFFSSVPESTEERTEALPLIAYTPYPGGLMVTRDSWSENAAVAWMKMGGLYMANHDHRDFGTFQIYYKGLLTGKSGTYNGDVYGSDHWKYYAQSTISANGLLVFDPSKLDTEPVYDANGNITNGDRYWYSGSMRILGEPGTLSNLLSGSYNYVTETGHSYGYSQDGANPEYAYIAGDLTNGYDSTTVDFIGRRMLTVYTDDPDYPMYLFVFDNITSDSEDMTKKFLLHTKNEAIISDNNGDGVAETVTTVNGEGKLVLTALVGNQNMVAIGGEGHAFEINGNNCYDGKPGYTTKPTWAENGGYEPTDHYDQMWGRVEITNTGSLSSHFLNVLYVTDSTNNEALTPALVESGSVYGGVIGNVAAIFAKSDIKVTDKLEFTLDGEELTDYYVSGLDVGTWCVYVNGEYLGSVYSTKDAGMVHFTAPAGRIELKPGKDILPEGHAKITYVIGGAELPKGTPKTYEMGVATSLDGITPSRGADMFAGWYTDAQYTDRITEISADSVGNIVLYAKWAIAPAYYDGVKEGSYGINHNADGKDSTFVYDDQNGYITWACPQDSPVITNNDVNKAIAKMNESVATYSFEFSLAEGKALMETAFRVWHYNAETGKHNGGPSSIFTTSSDGYLKFNGTSVQITDVPKAFDFVFDFESLTITMFVDGVKTGSPYYFNIHGHASNGRDFQDLFSNTIFNWRRQGTKGEALRIHKFIVFEGTKFEREDPSAPPATPEQPSNDRIVYPSGVTLPEGAPTEYEAGVTLLPGTATMSKAEFAGWYSDSALTKPITVIPEDAKGEFKVYAKWKYVPTYYDGVKDGSYGVSHNPDGKNSTVTYDDDGGFFVWACPEDSPIIHADSSDRGIAKMSETAVTYKLELSLAEGKSLMETSFRIVHYSPNEGKNVVAFALFTTLSSGHLSFNGTSVEITAEPKTFEFVLDFESFTANMYVDGEKVGNSLALNYEKHGATASEYQSLYKTTLYNWRRQGTKGEALAVHSFIISEGTDYTRDEPIVVTPPEQPEPEPEPEPEPDPMPEPDPTPEGNIIVYPSGIKLPTGAPTGYFAGVTELPSAATNGFSILVGWYSDEALTNPITVIPEDAEGEFKVYAKWKISPTYYDGDDSLKHGITFGTDGKEASFEYKDGYALFESAFDGPLLLYTATDKSHAISAMTENKVTYTLKLSRDGERELIATAFRMRNYDAATDGYIETGFTLFTTSADGYLKFNGTNVEVGSEMKRFDFVLDFELGIITLYVDGEKTGSDFTMPYEKYAATPIEYKALYDSRIYNWRRQGTTGEAMRIGAFIVSEGDNHISN